MFLVLFCVVLFALSLCVGILVSNFRRQKKGGHFWPPLVLVWVVLFLWCSCGCPVILRSLVLLVVFSCFWVGGDNKKAIKRLLWWRVLLFLLCCV